MEHATCRAAVLDDEAVDSADVQHHLAACAACRRFADDVARIVTTAPSLYTHAAPEGLADRALERVRSGTVTTVVSPPRRSLWADVRTPLLRSTAVAAALLLVLGLLAVARHDDQPTGPEGALLAAATATEEAGTAEVRVAGSVSVSVPRPPDGRPQFQGLPAEVEAYLSARWQEMMAQFNRQLADFERDTKAMLEEFNRQLDEFNRQIGNGQPNTRPTPPRPPVRNRTNPPVPPSPDRPAPTLPERLDLSFGIEGTGAVSFRGGGALGIDGKVSTVGGNVFTQSAAADFRLAAKGDDVVLRRPDGSWHRLPGAAGPLGAAVLRPGSVPRILRAAAGDVAFLGTSDFDGETLRHYRFQVDAADVVTVDDGTLRDRYEAEVYIGSDDRVRRLELTSAGSLQGQDWDTTLVLDLGRFGAATVNADAPPPSATAPLRLEGEADLITYPFGPAIGATLRR